jgi:hypothetical protein
LSDDKPVPLIIQLACGHDTGARGLEWGGRVWLVVVVVVVVAFVFVLGA